MGIPRKRCYLLGPPLTTGRLRSAWLLLPARPKPPPVALQVLPLGVNATTPPQSQRKKAKSTIGSTFKQAEEDGLFGVVLVQDNPYKNLTMNQAN